MVDKDCILQKHLRSNLLVFFRIYFYHAIFHADSYSKVELLLESDSEVLSRLVSLTIIVITQDDLRKI